MDRETIDNIERTIEQEIEGILLRKSFNNRNENTEDMGILTNILILKELTKINKSIGQVHTVHLIDS